MRWPVPGGGGFVKGVMKGMIGNARLIGGHIGYDESHDEIFKFFATKGTLSYNERTGEFKSKLQVR